MTDGQLGNRVLYAILLKNPQMFAPFREDRGHQQLHSTYSTPGVSQSMSCVTRKEGVKKVSWDHEINRDARTVDEPGLLNSLVIKPSSSLHSSLYAFTGASKMPPKIAIVAPLLRNERKDRRADEGNRIETDQVTTSPASDQPESQNIPPSGSEPTLMIIPHVKKKSIELISCAKFHRIGQAIMNFIGEVIEMMCKGASEQVRERERERKLLLIEYKWCQFQTISLRIQQVGKMHYDMGVTFTSSAWREFKSKTLSIISECDFASERVSLIPCTASFP